MAQVVLEMTADELKALRAMQRLQRQQEKIEQKMKDVAKSGQRAGNTIRRSFKKTQDEAFGPRAISQIKSYAASFLSVTAAVQGVTSAIRAMDQARQAAGTRAAGAEAGFAQLAQLSGGNPLQLQRDIQTATALFASGGAGSQDEASRILFSAKSAGFENELGVLADLYGIVPDTAGLARSSATLISSFGRAETGGLTQTISKGFGASAFSPSSVDALLQAAAGGAEFANQLGLSDEELLAAIAVAATGAGSAEQGGVNVAELLGSLVEKGGFVGKPLEESIREISASGRTPDQLKAFFGRKSAVKGFGILSRQLDTEGGFLEALQGVRTAEAINLQDQVVSAALAQPQIAIPARRRAEQNRLAVAEERQGLQRELSDAAIAQTAADLPFLQSVAFRAAAKFNRAIYGDQFILDNAPDLDALGDANDRNGLVLTPQTISRLAPGSLRAVDDLAPTVKALLRAATSLDRASERMESALGGGPALQPQGDGY